MAKLLPVIEHWKCQSSGDCCRLPRRVSMTYQERHELEAMARLGMASRKLEWRYNSSPKMTDLVAGPCPFVTEDNRCNAYDARPYNCRRFACLRPDPSAEAFVERGPLGSVNLLQRLIDSPVARAEYAAIQADAQPWALAHGWTGKES